MARRQRIAWLGTPSLGRIGLAIDGYQFPFHRPADKDDYDANWLMIHGKVEFPELGNWSLHDPCLLTWELESLIDWLREFPSVPDDSVEFLERLLHFFVDRSTRLAVTLRGEALRGAKLDDEIRWHRGQTLALQTTPASGRQFCDEMSEQLRRHPPR